MPCACAVRCGGAGLGLVRARASQAAVACAASGAGELVRWAHGAALWGPQGLLQDQDAALFLYAHCVAAHGCGALLGLVLDASAAGAWLASA